MKIKEQIKSVKKINLYASITYGVILILNFIYVYIRDLGYIPQPAARLGVALSVSVVAYQLSNARYYRTSGFMALLIPFSLVVIYPIVPFFFSRPAEDLFLLLFVYVILTVLVYVVYEIEKHLIQMIIWHMVMLIFFVYAVMHISMELDPERYGSIKEAFTKFPMLTLVYLGTLAFLHLLLINFQRERNRSTKDLLNHKEELQATLETKEKQKNDLEKQQITLLKKREELHDLHDELNARIEERSNELRYLNTVLEKYGFINTALIIKPMEQLEKELSRLQKEGNFEKLERTIDEMDELTNFISNFLNETDPEKIERLEKRLKDDFKLVI